jgi:hypothetical protein
MRVRLLTVFAASAASLAIAAPGLAQRQTTNPSQMLTVRVTITDDAITMKPSMAERGSNAIFILSNHGTKPHTLALGDAKRGVGRKIGFSTTLGPNQQKTIVMFLDYRGLLPYSSPQGADARKAAMKGIFRIT